MHLVLNLFSKNQPMWMFAAWGTSEEFTKNFTTIKDNITNSLVVVKVVFLKRISIETNGNKVSWKVLKGIFILATWEHCTLEKSEFLWHRNFEELLYRRQTSLNDFRSKELPTPPPPKKKTFNRSSTYRLNVLLLQLHSLCGMFIQWLPTDHTEINNLRVPCYFTWFSQVETMSIRNKTFLFKLIKLVPVDNVQ